MRQFTHVQLNRFHLHLIGYERESLWSAGEMSHLFAAPFEFTMPLKELSLSHDHTTITDGMVESLVRAMQFTRFQPSSIHIRDPSFLSAYTQLEY